MTAEGGDVHVRAASCAVDEEGQLILVVEALVPVADGVRHVELLPAELPDIHHQRRHHLQMLTEFLQQYERGSVMRGYRLTER